MVLSFDNAESANGTPEPHHDDDRGEPSRHIGIADEQDSETKKQRIESRVHATCLPHRGRNVTRLTESVGRTKPVPACFARGVEDSIGAARSTL